jgi:pimeloyl-ACP methyl ester carboxylesterase
VPVRIVLLLCLLSSPLLAAPPTGGRFTVYHRGREAGHEVVTFSRRQNLGIMVSNAVHLRGGRERRLFLSVTDHPLRVRLKDGEEVRTFERPDRDDRIVLLEPFAAPWIVLARRYDLAKGGRQEIPAWFPVADREGKVVVTRRENQAIEIDGRVHLATRLLAVPDVGEPANLWLGQDGGLLVCARSIAGISAVRGTRAVLGLKPGSDPPDPEGVTSVRIRFAADGITLAGTLSKPAKGDGPFPAVLLLSGSGPNDRNGNAPSTELQWNYLHSFAMALAETGIASLRYDERGVAKSGGTFADAGVADLLADANSALGYLRSREDVRADRVAVLGHSEGALLAASLAGGGGARAMVLIGPPAEPLDRILLSQVAARLAREGLGKPAAQRILGDLRAFFEHVRLAENDVVTWSGRIRDVRWLREHMAIDPAAVYRAASVPALVLHGGRDMQVPASHGERVAAALPESEFVLLPALDHFLMPGTGRIEDYADAVRRVDPVALTRMSDWVQRILQ